MAPPEKKPGAGGAEFFVSHCRFDLAVAWGLTWGHVDRFVITDCLFESHARNTWPWQWHCNGATNFVVRNNRIRYAAGRLGFSDSHHGIIENNHVTRLGDEHPPKGETGGFNLDYTHDVAMLSNRFDVAGKAIGDRNQGETICTQGCNPEHQDAGIVSRATAVTLSDATRTWGTIRTPSLSTSDAVAIVRGRGAGQWRRIVSNTANTLQLDRAWEVIPDQSSHYVIMRWSSEDWLIKDNYLQDGNRGIWIYCGNTDMAIVGNTLINSEGIYLRSDQRVLNESYRRYNLSWNTVVENNKVINTNGKRPAFIGTMLALVNPDSLFGIGTIGVEFRRNYVQAHTPNSATFVQGEGYWNQVQAKTPIKGNCLGIMGTIFESNIVVNADIGYRLSKQSSQTVIKDAVSRNVQSATSDSPAPDSASRQTVFVSPCTGGKSTDPFCPYLTRKAPEISKDLGEERVDSADVKIQRVIFHSRDTQTSNGTVPTRIFAAIARPGKAGNYPGILILHGGGGSAEVDKAVRWAAKGYIAVAIDLPGVANPAKVPHSSGHWKTFEYGKNRFTASPDITHSTIFDGVLAALQGIYLLQAQPDVIKERIGVTGISWGGYMTTMVSGLAGEYVHAAFSTYGSGFYDVNSTFLKDLDNMPAAQRKTWLTYLDAGRRAKYISAPFFIAGATNDHWFYPPAVMATLNEMNSPVNHFFAPNANHAAPVPGGNAEADRVGWMKMELDYFDYYLKDKGAPLPQIILGNSSFPQEQDAKKCTIRFRVQSQTDIAQAKVFYSTSDTTWTKRKWLDMPTSLTKDGWYEATLPVATEGQKVYWFVSVSDSRPVTVSSVIRLYK